MSRIALYVNGHVEFDGELNEWVATPPDFVKDMLKPEVTVAPWMKAVMLSLTDAVMQNKSLSMDVRTSEKSWQLTVETVT